jgi:hypothetical protein
MKIAASIWFFVVVTAMAAIANFSNTPGEVGVTPTQWPTQSQMSLDEHVPTLIMFVHPHCPCTQASVGELEVLMANCQGQVKVQVVFIKPDGTTEDWMQTDLWRRVAAMPGVMVHRDNGGVEAGRFNAETSGFTVLYNPAGRLLFAGGITISRGHSGDNPGRSAIETILTQGLPNQVTTPVFGCSLLGTACRLPTPPRQP